MFQYDIQNVSRRIIAVSLREWQNTVLNLCITRHVASLRKWGMCTQSSSRNLKWGHHLRDLDIDGRLILKWILRKYEFVNGFTCLRIMYSSGLLWERPSVSIKGVFLNSWATVSFSKRNQIYGVQFSVISALYFTLNYARKQKERLE
jgi:hypothetical protein